MLWYEPWSSPAEWALHNRGNIKVLASNWVNCKYNPSVIKVFISDESFNFYSFANLLRLYEESQADPCQYKDLFLMCFDTIKNWVNSEIEWKFSKLSEDDKKVYAFDIEFYNIVLQASLYLNGEPTQIIINNYPDISKLLKNHFTNDVIECYKRDTLEHNPHADTYVDKDYAENVINAVIKKHSEGKCCKTTIMDLGFEGSAFSAFVCNLFSEPRYYEYYVGRLVQEVLDTYAAREHHRIAGLICAGGEMIDDSYDTLLKCACCKDKPSDMTIALLANDECCKKNDIDQICKLVKIATNNINHSYGDKISKSCEDAIIEGIKNYDDIILSIGMFDIDECITALEAIGYGIDIVTEARYDDEEEPEPDQDMDQEEPIEDDEESTSKKSATKATVKDTKRRDFDADFRKYKKNIKNVDVSLTKILSTLKGYLTGTSEARGIRKATGMDSLGQILARVFGTIAVFHVSKFLGILFVIVRLANSHKVTDRERAKLITEIKNEIETIDSQLSDGSVESAEAKQNLTRTKQNLQDALEKISTRRGKNMTEGSKQAVRDLVDRR